MVIRRTVRRRIFTIVGVLAFAVVATGQDSCDMSSRGGGKDEKLGFSAGQPGGQGRGGGGLGGAGGLGGDDRPVDGSGGDCIPGYSPCLPPAPDYDCEGGTGDGPEYTGQVSVSGSDPYDLDADGNGTGCE